jgi:hypothetical protein
MVSRLDVLIHKASIVIQIQPSRCQSAWSGRAWIRYGNCVHQNSRPNDHPFGLDARSLHMEITCNGRATVRTIVAHPPDEALKQERSSAKFLEFRSYSCSSGQPITTVRTTPNFIKPDANLSPQPLNRGSCAWELQEFRGEFLIA